MRHLHKSLGLGFEDYIVTSAGEVWSVKSKQYLKPMDNRRGYKYVTLWKDGVRHNQYIHRLVAQAFIPNPKGYPQVNHKDEDKSNNSVGNLEWCTNLYNHNYGTMRRRMVETRSRNKEWIRNVRRAGKNRRKPIAMIDVSTDEIIRVFDSLTAAAAVFKGGASASPISDVARHVGGHVTAYGFRWEYINA